MNSLISAPVADVLSRLFHEAQIADGPMICKMRADAAAGADPIVGVLEAEARDYRGLYHEAANNFLTITPEFGQLLYLCARAQNACHIVEFGTSFGISAIYLASALRDNDGGAVISTELEPTKAARAYAHLQAAGLADLVEIRVGDALDTLNEGITGPIDLVHLDGAFGLYLPVLALLEPHLKTNALILAENGTESYLNYVRDPGHGYVSLPTHVQQARGNEVSLFTR